MDTPWWIPFGRVPGVSASALAAELRGPTPPQLLDVRSGPEFASGRIEGAVHAPITAFTAHLEALGLDRRRAVVAICLTAHRSIPAVRLLRRQGFQVRQLEGGMLAWRAAGLPETRPTRP
jgi:rhodanese-related sulfurtransferase